MKRLLKRCAAQVLVLVYYATAQLTARETMD